MNELPAGWVQRRSGVFVPVHSQKARRVATVGRGILVGLLLAAPIASRISTVVRAALEVDEVFHVLLPPAHDLEHGQSR
jgi:hypothetical protein